MIEAVFFDYDGVITLDKTGSLTTCRYLSQRLGLPLADVQAAMRPHNDALNFGRTTHQAVWPAVCQALGRDVPFEWLEAAFESTPLNGAMLALARRLKATYRLGLITDNKRDRMEHVCVCQGLDGLFDPIVVSSVVGSSKESAAIFEHALACLQLEPRQALFIDNTPANLVAPATLGMPTVHFDDERQDMPALEASLRGHGLMF